ALGRSQSIDQALTAASESAESLDSHLAANLRALRLQWSDLTQRSDAYPEMRSDGWRTARSDWVAQLRRSIVRHRNLGHIWSFNLHEKRLLKQYYRANQLLLECLGRSGDQRSMQKSLLSLPLVELNTPVAMARLTTSQGSFAPVAPLLIKLDTK
ncbi:MAG: hypothetical protein LH660_02370, partial [Phormidesmis sp. CAN_BIN36]|nr:hypothetical protein [Phormidesmis sp. CAN_BIN36]